MTAIARRLLAPAVAALLLSALPATAWADPKPDAAGKSAATGKIAVNDTGTAPSQAARDAKKVQRADDKNQVDTAGGSEPEVPPPVAWSFDGPFGHYDIAQLQRGFRVYKEVCANCHSMKMVAFRNLADLGYSAGQIKALAATYQVEDGPNDKGEMYKRPGRPADYFPSPFPNPEAAAAIYGKAPPDMSDLAKARGWERGFPAFLFDFFTTAEETEGPTYIHAVLNGYTKPDDPHYNAYLPNHKIAMPKPLSDGQVSYSDGMPQTVEQYSRDVSAFLMWAAEPKLEERKILGLRAMTFLAVFATLLFFVKKRIWSQVGGDVVVGAR